MNGDDLDTREILTYTTLRMFRDCRKMYDWRINHQLVPLERPHAMGFGSLIHGALECWHRTRVLPEVIAWIDAQTMDEERSKDRLLATAMLTKYAERYPTESFEVLSLEEVIFGEIRNPETAFASRTFRLGMRYDGLVRDDGGLLLLEHKTTSQIDGGYLERLWTDFQVAIYVRKLQEHLGMRIEGVLYNILQKPGLKQAKGETAEEYEIRRAALLAKSKSGKSNAQRQLPETDEDYYARLLEKLSAPDAFHRERLILDDRRIDDIEAELWELTQQLLVCRRKGVWYQNNSFCFHYNRPCPYFQMCKSGGSELVKDQLYRVEPPHEELREEEGE